MRTRSSDRSVSMGVLTFLEARDGTREGRSSETGRACWAVGVRSGQAAGRWILACVGCRGDLQETRLRIRLVRSSVAPIKSVQWVELL